MSEYRFSGRIASFFRATGNRWASARMIGETVGPNRIIVQRELNTLIENEYVERRGARGSYEYRWDEKTLYHTKDRQPEVGA